MQRHLVVSLFFALGLCLLIAGCGSKTPSPRPSSQNANQELALPPVVATVNGRSISTKLYEMYLKNGREALELDPNTDEGRRKLEQLREGIVSELIDRAVISDEAIRRRLVIPEVKMAEAERRAIAELGGEGQYDAYLKEHRLSRDEYREVIRQQVYGDMMRQELRKDLMVSAAEIKTYYEAHRNDKAFQQLDRVTASHILIAARPNLIAQQLEREKKLSGDELAIAVREEIELRRGRAEELRRKAAAGADFATLARQSSEDAGTRQRGGDLGTFSRNSHSAAFDAAAFALKPGEISKVVQTEYGFHVIKVSAYHSAGTLTLADATPEIRRRLLAEREANRLAEWLKQARSKASIIINEPFRFGALRDQFPPP